MELSWSPFQGCGIPALQTTCGIPHFAGIPRVSCYGNLATLLRESHRLPCYGNLTTSTIIKGLPLPWRILPFCENP
eukprot:3269292-Prymnesium_polylepis.1